MNERRGWWSASSMNECTAVCLHKTRMNGESAHKPKVKVTACVTGRMTGKGERECDRGKTQMEI